jgi:hypothetical protein
MRRIPRSIGRDILRVIETRREAGHRVAARPRSGRYLSVIWLWGNRTGRVRTTVGVLEYHGASVNSTWPDVVPLGQPFHVREPVWTWGLGASLIDSDGTAIAAICVSLLLLGVGILVLYFIFRMIRNSRRHRRARAVTV